MEEILTECKSLITHLSKSPVFIALCVVYVLKSVLSALFPKSTVSTVRRINTVDEWNLALTELKSSYSNAIVVIDFFATWSSDCRSYSQDFDLMSVGYCSDLNKCQFWKIDIDKAAAICTQVGVTSPQIKFFVNALQVGELKVWNKRAVINTVDKHIAGLHAAGLSNSKID